MISSLGLFDVTEGFRKFNENVCFNSNREDVQPVSILRGGGPVWALPYALEDAVGDIAVELPPGPMVSIARRVDTRFAMTSGLRP